MNLNEPRELASLLEAFMLASGKPQSLERFYELFEEAERPEQGEPGAAQTGRQLAQQIEDEAADQPERRGHHHDGSHQGRAEAAAEPQASAEREQYPDDHHHAGIPP